MVGGWTHIHPTMGQARSFPDRTGPVQHESCRRGPHVYQTGPVRTPSIYRIVSQSTNVSLRKAECAFRPASLKSATRKQSYILFFEPWKLCQRTVSPKTVPTTMRKLAPLARRAAR